MITCTPPVWRICSHCLCSRHSWTAYIGLDMNWDKTSPTMWWQKHIEGVPKNGTNRKKIITKIEHCGAKFYHVHYLEGLILLSLSQMRPQWQNIIFRIKHQISEKLKIAARGDGWTYRLFVRKSTAPSITHLFLCHSQHILYQVKTFIIYHIFLNFITNKICFDDIFVIHDCIFKLTMSISRIKLIPEGCVSQRTICKGCFMEVMYIMDVALVHKGEDKCCWQNLWPY